MGFALLSGVPPEYGLYTSLFPSVIYFLLGTSHHISIGTMAITSLMTGAVVERQIQNYLPAIEEGPTGMNIAHLNATESWVEARDKYAVSITTSLALLQGAWQVKQTAQVVMVSFFIDCLNNWNCP